jgi:hypothetical protein
MGNMGNTMRGDFRQIALDFSMTPPFTPSVKLALDFSMTPPFTPSVKLALDF